MDRDCFWLNDRQFARLRPYLPTDTRGKPRVDDRRVISGIIHVLKSGCRWIDAPAVYGPRKTLYNRFVRWAAKTYRRGRVGSVFLAFGHTPSVVMMHGSVPVSTRGLCTVCLLEISGP